MNIERRLKICTALTACLGTVILGVGEGNYLLAAMAVVVSLGALVLCDLYDWFRLNNLGSNIISSIILLITVRRLAVGLPDEHVLVMADLMGYLQFVLQFKRKTIRNYWLLGLVSFLQTAVASALHTGLGFMLLLTAYLFCGLFFLGYFYLYRERRRFEEQTRAAEATARESTGGFFGRSPDELTEKAAAQDLSRRLTGIGLGTIAITAIFFTIIPRLDQNRWTTSGMVEARTVGFSPEINLNNTAALVDDPDEVMQVRFKHPVTDEPYLVAGDIYLRGGSAVFYEQGRWRAYTLATSPRVAVIDGEVIEKSEIVRQVIRIEPSSTKTLFSTLPAYVQTSNHRLLYDTGAGQFSRPDARTPLEYEMLTTAFRDHQQLDLVPLSFRISPQRERGLLQLPPKTGDADPIAGLKAAAEAAAGKIPKEKVFERAKALEAYLRESGEFFYAREPGTRADDVDPLEHFVTSGRQGHCEYFAGALALMLRSMGIPARVVLGYRGGEFNVVGNFYRFQQLHAHSWVEAYIPTDQIPAGRIPSIKGTTREDYFPLGAWLQLDATPMASRSAAIYEDSTWQQLQQLFDYARFLWTNYVVGMDSTRQRESIYQPMIARLKEWRTLLFDRRTWAGWWHALMRRIDPMNWNIELLSWRGGLLILGFIGGFWLCVLGVMAARRWLRRRRMIDGPRRRRPAFEVEFYVRLEKLLKRLDLTRSPDQTQREFALAAGGELAESAATRGAAPLPKKIVDAYYRVRFGQRPLDNDELQDVELALKSLGESLVRPKGDAG